jgi:DNA adenine methylase
MWLVRPQLPSHTPAPLHRPFLKWAGGKTLVVPRIRAALDAVGADRLVEPFVGSGAVFLNLPRFRRLLLADANADLVALYSFVHTEPDALVDAARALFTAANNTRTSYDRLRAELNAAPVGDLRRAARFIYLNRHGFNGLCRYNASGGFNVPFGRYKAPGFPEAELRAMHARLAEAEQVEILNVDFRAVFEERLEDGDVVYADPPYVPLSAAASFTSYSADGFGTADQQALADAARVAAARGIPVLLSNHDTPAVRDLYAGATITSFPVRRSISRDGSTRGEVAEVLALFRGSRR